jgi:hypothetical protein
MKPRSGPRAKDPNSKTQRVLARRTTARLTPRMRERRDRYVAALLHGATKTEAARAAGFSPRSALQRGATLWNEPFVQQRFRQLRAKLERDELLDFAELALNVKSIAFNEDVDAGARIAAHALLARLFGFESPKESRVAMTGGVLLIPVAGNIEAWEQAAIAAQRKLQAASE